MKNPLTSIMDMARGGRPASPSAEPSSGPAAPPEMPTTPDERNAILAAIDKLIGPIPTGSGPGLPAETIASIAAASPEPLASPAEVETLRKLDAEWVNAWKVANSYDRLSAKAAYRTHCAETAARARAGTITEVEDTWTQNDWLEDHMQRGRAGKLAALNAANDATPIVTAIANRFRVFARVAIEQELLAEFRSYQRFSIPFEPSKLVRTLHACLDGLPKHLPRDGQGIRPRVSAALFNIKL